MPGVFISYRRKDTDGHAGRLAADLRSRFGRENVFIDVDSIEGGTPFEERIDRALDGSDVAFVLIGPQWLGSEPGARRKARKRIQEPDDWVRREVAAVLQRADVTVVPVLVEEAPMPSPGDLPGDISKLVGLQAQELSTRQWAYDFEGLCDIVDRDVRAPGGRVRRWWRRSRQSGAAWALAGILAVVTVGVVVLLASRGGSGGAGVACVNQTISPTYRAQLSPAAGVAAPARKGVFYGSCGTQAWALAKFPGGRDGVFKRGDGKWARLGAIADEMCSVPGPLLDQWHKARCDQ